MATRLISFLSRARRLSALVIAALLAIASNMTRTAFAQTWPDAPLYTSAAATGSANAQVVVIPNFAGVLPNGQPVRFYGNVNNTSAATITFKDQAGNNALGPLTVKKKTNGGLAALTGNEIVGSQINEVVYDGAYLEIGQPQSAGAPMVGSTGLVGSSAGSSTSASYTIQEATAEGALGGTPYKGANLSLTFNCASSAGAGAMDTGTCPSSGVLYVYAITNGSGTWNALGTISGAASPVYAGSNMPAGYIASVLIGAYEMTGGDLPQFNQQGKRIDIPLTNALNCTSSCQTSFASVSISTIVPPDTIAISGNMGSNVGSGDTAPNIAISGTNSSNNVGVRYCLANFGETAQLYGFNGSCPFSDLMVPSGQTFYYLVESSSTNSARVSISQYVIQ